MPITKPVSVLIVALLAFATGIAIYARGAHQPLTASQVADKSSASLSSEERTRLLAEGKELFMARCASCHDERGDKPLSSGPPLNERGLSSERIAGLVDGRLRQKTEQQRRAVTLYISSLMKAKDSEQKPPAKP